MKDRACVDATACCVGTTTYGTILGCLAVGCVPSIAGGIADCVITTATCGLVPLMHTDEKSKETTCVIGSVAGNVAGCVGGIAGCAVGGVLGTLFAPVAACTSAPDVCRIDDPQEKISSYRFGGPKAQFMK